LEKALAMPENYGHAVNGLEHVWGYFKKKASDKEKERFQTMVRRYAKGQVKLATAKKDLLKLAEKYHSSYLLQSYYFIL
jgi:UV DNA damage endonuclease